MADDRGEGESSGLVPLFPLKTVLFPGGVYPLHTFERRYWVLARERRDFVVVLIKEGGEVGSGQVDEVHEVGTLARPDPDRIEEHADGSYSLVAHGVHRVRLLSVDRRGQYWRARIRRLDDPRTPPRPRLAALLGRYLADHGLSVPPEIAAQLVDPAGMGPARAVWLAGAVMQEADLDHRQELLEGGDPRLAEVLLHHELR